MENRLRLLALFLVVFLTTFLSIGFSAFQDNLVVKDVSATVRLRKNIRITSIASQGGNSNNEINKDGYTDYDEYDVDNIESKIVLPSKYSTITYTIEITNFGDYEMALTEIGDLPNDLEFKNIDYTYGTKLCEGNRCNHGSVNTIHFTVGYKDSVTQGFGDEITVYLEFLFKKVYGISYVGFDSVSGLDTDIVEDETVVIDFSSVNPVPGAVVVNGALGSYNTNTHELTLSNVSGNVTITSAFTISYIGFPGDVSGLVTSIGSSGGNIQFSSTTGIPSSVVVTGAVSNYNSSTYQLTLSNVTGNVTVTFVGVSAKAYETLINIYNDSIVSEDSTCDNSLLYDNTTDSNLRFVGSKPCNYVYFNCSDPDNPSSSTCEKWRIVGIFNRNNHSVLKIINSSFYNNGSNVKYHAKNNSSNRLWGTNDLSTTINGTYYNSMSSGTQNFIESVNWPLGGLSSNRNNVLSFYNAENGTFSSSSIALGLLNITDFIYSTNANNRESSCFNITLNNINGTCLDNSTVNWLYSGTTEFTVTTDGSRYIFKMQNNYIPYTTKPNDSYAARVVTHLKNNVYFDGGVGSQNDPYVLKLANS